MSPLFLDDFKDLAPDLDALVAAIARKDPTKRPIWVALAFAAADLIDYFNSTAMKPWRDSLTTRQPLGIDSYWSLDRQPAKIQSLIAYMTYVRCCWDATQKIVGHLRSFSTNRDWVDLLQTAFAARPRIIERANDTLSVENWLAQFSREQSAIADFDRQPPPLSLLELTELLRRLQNQRRERTRHPQLALLASEPAFKQNIDSGDIEILKAEAVKITNDDPTNGCILELHYAGYSGKEIGERVGLTPGAVSQRFQKIIGRLADAVDAYRRSNQEW